MRKYHDLVMDFLLCLSALMLLGGCANSLVFTTGTTFGLDISQRPDQTVNVTLGYDRVEVASIPTSENTDADSRNDAYSVLGTFNVHYGNPWQEPLELHQFFATGMAARKAAKSAQLQEFFGKKAAGISQKEVSKK